MSAKERLRPKKYVCTEPQCGKSYTRPCLLRQHQRTHANMRPFLCLVPDCGKAFYRQSHLEVHSWSHSAIKPLSCGVCHKGFVTSQQLLRHKDKHHERELICPHGCADKFQSQQEMCDHMLLTHLLNNVADSHKNDTWDDLFCKENECTGFPQYDSSLSLFRHYDDFHEMVPESLFTYFVESPNRWQADDASEPS
ncbi:hypothetical protein KL938_004958 [Ogataea parapolymorpha]|nr:hypothetical protein KL938_004958 [Ogataea parapolymorpha]